jgi:hypothetical protein
LNESGKVPDHLISECRKVAENSLYNAQAHFVLADRLERHARWMLMAPAALAGTCGILTAVGLPAWLGAFSAIGGFFAATAAVLGIDRAPTSHRLAANQWTALRHEADSLSETYFKELPHEQFVAEVRRIDDRYNTLCQSLEPTDKKAFDMARAQIKAGVFKTDSSANRA